MDTLSFVVDKYHLHPVIGRASSQLQWYWDYTEIPNISRADLAKLFAELGFRRGVEIGTERGIYAQILCECNPELQLSCVDPWAVYDGGKGYRLDATPELVNACYVEAQVRLKFYQCELIRDFSVPAAKLFQDESLDFVYIDGNHSLPYVIADLAAWVPKVRPGGIVSGHDFRQYLEQRHSHVVEALYAYTRAYEITPWFVLGAKSGGRRDTYRSWFFVKSSS